MREIATALAMSHQRVHQIIGEEGIVEVEVSATEIGHLPVPVASSALAVTAGEDSCSFCGAPRRELEKLLAAPGPVFVCSACVTRVTSVFRGRSAADLRLQADAPGPCSFCGNASTIAGSMVESLNEGTRMCAKCADTCQRLVTTDEAKKVMSRRNPKIRCSFCNASQSEAQKIIAGPAIYICGDCVAAAGEVLTTHAPAKGPRQVVLRDAKAETHPCAFCTKLPIHVPGLVKGGRGRICDECLALCNDILAEESGG
jgi:ATP-dependent protease Clp ATPase subunit